VVLEPVLAEEARGIGALGIDWVTLVVYLVNFGILLGLLYVVAYKPVLKMLDHRSRMVRESLEEVDRVRDEAKRQQEELEKRFQEGRQESQRLLVQAKQMAQQYREEEATKARREAEQFLVQARETVQRENEAALHDVRVRFVDLAVLAAERVIERSLDREAHREVLERMLEETTEMKEG